jgi:dihydropteroate synthase
VNEQNRSSLVYRFGRKEMDLGARTYVMGILNVTPDSFSDGGKYATLERAVDGALAMIEVGADLIDIGGESTRPRGGAYGEGSEPVSEEEEIRRVLPVIERLVGRTDVPLSVDTYKSGVARRALEAGAVVVNDISGFRFDPAMPAVVASAGASAVLMHIQGTPKTMQQHPAYDDLIGEVTAYLRESLRRGREHGVRQMLVDPGLGFGKTLEHNLRLIRGIGSFRSLGVPVLIGPSRKTFIGTLLNAGIEDRLEGSLAATVACVLYGANVVRVHDVREAKRAVTIADAIRKAGAVPEYPHLTPET